MVGVGWRVGRPECGVLNFAVFDASGKLDRTFALRHAHLFGADDLPVQGDIEFVNGLIRCERPGGDSTGLAVQIEVPASAEVGLTGVHKAAGLGLLTLQTCLLPQREQPYSLWLELARHRIMLFLNKLEEWGLFDAPAAEPVLKEFEQARREFTESLVVSKNGSAMAGDEAAASERLAIRALILGIDASERLAVLEARQELPRRLTGATYKEAVQHYTRITAETPQPGAAISLQGATGVALPGAAQVGVAVEPQSFAEPMQKAVMSSADFITVPMRWVDLEPTEGKYNFTPTDRWIEWAVRTAKLPVVAGPILDFRALCVPDYLFIWENDYETLREMVAEHINQVVTRYRRTVSRWTVASGLHVNSDLKLTIDQIIDLTRVAALLVRKLHPQARVQVEVAQPWGEYHARAKKSLPPLLYADAIMQVGLPVDTIGVRVQMGQPSSGRSTRDLCALSAMLDRYAGFQRPVAVSALGVPSAEIRAEPVEADEGYDAGRWRGAWSDAHQSDWATQALAVIAAKPYVQSVCWQQVADGPGAEMPSGGLLTAGGAAKPIAARWAELRHALKSGIGIAGMPGLGQF